MFIRVKLLDNSKIQISHKLHLPTLNKSNFELHSLVIICNFPKLTFQQ